MGRELKNTKKPRIILRIGKSAFTFFLSQRKGMHLPPINKTSAIFFYNELMFGAIERQEVMECDCPTNLLQIALLNEKKEKCLSR